MTNKEPEFTITQLNFSTKKGKINRQKYKYNNLAPPEKIRDFWFWKKEKFRTAVETAMKHPEIPLHKIAMKNHCHYQEISRLMKILKNKKLILEQ